MAEWFAVGFSVVAIIISGLAFYSGLPRLKIKAFDPAIIVNAPASWGQVPVAIMVTLTNDGGAAAHIDRLYLEGEGIFAKILAGPNDFPMKIEARGGSARWQFDYRDLREQFHETIRQDFRDADAPLSVRATVQYGSRARRSNPITVDVPGGSGLQPLSLNERLRRYIRSWTKPRLSLLSWHTISFDDVSARVQRVQIMNLGRGKSRPGQLILTVQHADGSREAVKGVPPLAIPRIRGKRTIELEASYVNDSEFETSDQFWWSLKEGSGKTFQGIGATRLSEVPNFIATLERHETQQNKSEC